MSSNWKLFGTGNADTFENYKTTWGLTNSTVYQYIYDLSGGQVANGTNLTENNWKQYDTTSNPTLSANTGYWVRVDESALSPGIYVNSSNGEVKLVYNVPEGTNVSITNFTWKGTDIVNTIYGETVTALTGLNSDHINSASYTDGSNPFLSPDGFQVKPESSGFGGTSPAEFTGGSGASPGFLSETGETIIFKLENVIPSVPTTWELRLNTGTFTQNSLSLIHI